MYFGTIMVGRSGRGTDFPPAQLHLQTGRPGPQPLKKSMEQRNLVLKHSGLIRSARFQSVQAQLLTCRLNIWKGTKKRKKAKKRRNWYPRGQEALTVQPRKQGCTHGSPQAHLAAVDMRGVLLESLRPFTSTVHERFQQR